MAYTSHAHGKTWAKYVIASSGPIVPGTLKSRPSAR